MHAGKDGMGGGVITFVEGSSQLEIFSKVVSAKKSLRTPIVEPKNPLYVSLSRETI